MLARPTLKKPLSDKAATTNDQIQPAEGRFLLRVDGQIKRSFSSEDPALTAGSAIKKAYPVLAVSVVDTEDGTTKVITA